MTRRARWIVAGSIGLVLVAPIVVTTVHVRSALPQLDGEIAIRGAGAEIELVRDSFGVPHIFARDEHDLLFAQGFAHAQDRLWQMELFRRVADGRLAEILGDDLVDADRFLRTIGLGRAATAQESITDDATMRLLHAYAAGVNAFLESRTDALPPEFLALGFEPEPWTPRNSLAVERVMSWDLAGYGSTVEATRDAQRLGEERARRLMPAYPEWGPTIIELPVIPSPPRAAAELVDALGIVRASNAWVIGGSRTRSGKPILANDMHLALRVPGVWYLMGLHAGALDVAGMTLPGSPYVVAGHNRAIAWGYTNAMVDDVDLFIERIDPADSSRYLTPDGSRAFDIISESILVRGRDASIVFDIRMTRHGPIIDELSNGPDSLRVAMQWSGTDPSHTLDALRRFNHATGWQDFLAAVERFDNPHQNVVYADSAGNFGYAMGGRIPVRGDGRIPPTLPVPGWTGEWDWNGYMPFSAHPVAFNPENGYVVTANNRQAAGELADRIATEWESPYRAARIRDMIVAGGPVDAEAVHAMQLDVRDLHAERYRSRAVDAARAAGLDAAARTLDAWDLRAARDSRGAALFYAWYEMLNRNAGRALFGSDGVIGRPALDAILEAGELPWGAAAAGFDSISQAAIRLADSIAAGKTWGDLHSVVVAHPLAASAILDRVLDLDVGPVDGDGSTSTVNVSQYLIGVMPVVAAYGPSQRHVVDMADIDGAGGFILPTGQSGIPFSAHYRDQFDAWRDGGLRPIPVDRDAANARVVHRLVLRPISSTSNPEANR